MFQDSVPCLLVNPPLFLGMLGMAFVEARRQQYQSLG
jgi:hypothetical protein